MMLFCWKHKQVVAQFKNMCFQWNKGRSEDRPACVVSVRGQGDGAAGATKYATPTGRKGEPKL